MLLFIRWFAFAHEIDWSSRTRSSIISASTRQHGEPWAVDMRTRLTMCASPFTGHQLSVMSVFDEEQTLTLIITFSLRIAHSAWNACHLTRNNLAPLMLDVCTMQEWPRKSKSNYEIAFSSLPRKPQAKIWMCSEMNSRQPSAAPQTRRWAGDVAASRSAES